MINANYGLNSNLTVGSGFTVFLSNSDVNSGNIFATSVSTSGNISASSVVASGVISASSATIGGNISALNINVSGNIIMPNGTVTVSNVATVAGPATGTRVCGVPAGNGHRVALRAVGRAPGLVRRSRRRAGPRGRGARRRVVLQIGRAHV